MVDTGRGAVVYNWGGAFGFQYHKQHGGLVFYRPFARDNRRCDVDNRIHN